VDRTGRFFQRTASSSSLPSRVGVSAGAAVLPRSGVRTLAEVALLMASGMLVVVLHRALRMPLGLPGRHGIEWMAILVIARCASSLPMAASVSMVGAAALSVVPLFGAVHDPFIWLAYLVPGLVVDGLWRVLPKSKARVWVTALLLLPVMTFAHMTKPIIRFIVSLIAGWPYGSIRFGVAYPVLTHALFGLAGGVMGVALFYGCKAAREKLGKGVR
jgi:hypothetical protein